MTDLLTRLENAKEGSRELDWAIRDQVCADAGEISSHIAPHYTTSLDAALTLVPEGGEENGEGWRIGIERGPGRETYWTAWLRRHASDETIEATAIYKAGPALALCIAALRARAA